MSNAGDFGLAYWLRWQVIVCALIILMPLVVAVFLLRRPRAQNLRSGDLWIPCWRNLHPLWLLLYRALVFLSMASMLYRVTARFGVTVFFFYTQWTFVLVMAYFAVGTILSAYGCWVCSKKSSTKSLEVEEPLRSGEKEGGLKNGATVKAKDDSDTSLRKSYYTNGDIPRIWGYLLQLLYQTSAGASMLTDIVFWCVLVPLQANKTFKLDLLIGSMHSLNALFLAVDTGMNNLPFSWLGFLYFVLWGCLYISFQWTIHLCGVSWWPYPFLDLLNPWAPLWYVGMAVIHVPSYGIYGLVVKAKLWIGSTFFPHAFMVHQ